MRLRSPCAGRPWVVVVLAATAVAAAALLRGGVASAAEGAATERWYEILLRGQKLGYSRVVWAPSTWNGKPTVHDTTTEFRRHVREMLGMRDEFVTTVTIDLERGEDGTLWWQKVVEREADRTITSELTWTGDGYDHVSRLGNEETKIRVVLEAPVMTDVESFLGPRARAGTLKAGETMKLRTLDLRARGAHESDVTVIAKETVAGERGEIETYKVEERDPKSGATTLLWIDDSGAFVRIKGEGGSAYARTTAEKAKETPVHPVEQSITTPSNPPLERIFSADRVLLDLHLRGDPDRPLPAFPDSPWSKVLGTSGDDAKGWVVKIELKKYDSEQVHATLPVDRAKFERELEPTVLMPVKNPILVEAAMNEIGEETDLRAAAHRLARFVYSRLEKHSADVNQADALQILRECKGDCSEHALLFVALCRAAGIPARLCSGYVSVGSAWGAHAWAEIWTGQWIGADPTTGEVGTGARYLFFGYQDPPDDTLGVVSGRAQGRMRFVTTRVEEGDDAYDIGGEETWYLSDKEKGRYVHVLAGIELRDVPEDWAVTLNGDADVQVRAPGLRAKISASADQGAMLENLDLNWKRVTFALTSARMQKVGAGDRIYLLHSRRRFIQIRISADDEEKLALFEKVIAPTFAPRPTH